LGKCKDPFRTKSEILTLRLKEMLIHACTIETSLRQTFQLQFWITEE